MDISSYILKDENDPFKQTWTMSWNDMYLPAFAKLYSITKEKKYKKALEFNINYWIEDVPVTKGGLKYLDRWGALRYALAESFIAMQYYKHDEIKDFLELAISQINYTLGNNPAKLSYIVGYGKKWPMHVHHRAANGYDDIYKEKKAQHTLKGALVGGPDINDKFMDDVTKIKYTESGIDYNATLIAALANYLGINEK